MLWLAFSASAAETNEATGKFLQVDGLGRVVEVPTNQVPAGFLPRAATNLDRQIPTPTEGTRVEWPLLDRMRAAAKDFRWFPATPPPLMPYLASEHEYGNSAVRPGPLIQFMPFEPWVQGGKYWLSDIGFRYKLEQTLTFAQMSGEMKGEDTLGFYALDFKSKWAVFNSAGGGTAGWLSTEVEVKTPLDDHTDTQDAKSNLGTITDPTGIWNSINGVRIPELGWQQSMRDGELVFVAGIVDQGNYLDRNAYAQSGRGQFINSALIHSSVLPLSKYNFGVNAQWQPLDDWYFMAGASVGDAPGGYPPWSGLNQDTWSLIGEFGYAPRDVLGLGPGIYRLQPFVAKAKKATQGGVCLSLQQQIGQRTPFGWFGRFGVGGDEVADEASSQIGTGFVMHAPLKHLGLVERLSNDLLGVGFIWSQPAATSKQVYHENEYVLESFYTLQFSPSVKLMPDIQYISHPAFNSKHDEATVFQLQLVLTW